MRFIAALAVAAGMLTTPAWAAHRELDRAHDELHRHANRMISAVQPFHRSPLHRVIIEDLVELKRLGSDARAQYRNDGFRMGLTVQQMTLVHNHMVQGVSQLPSCAVAGPIYRRDNYAARIPELLRCLDEVMQVYVAVANGGGQPYNVGRPAYVPPAAAFAPTRPYVPAPAYPPAGLSGYGLSGYGLGGYGLGGFGISPGYGVDPNCSLSNRRYESRSFGGRSLLDPRSRIRYRMGIGF